MQLARFLRIIVPTGRQIKLLRYALPYWRSLALVVVTMLLSVGTNLLTPWPVKFLVDDVLGNHRLPPVLERVFITLPGSHDRMGLLIWIAVGSVLVFLANSLVQLVNNLAGIVFGQRVTYNLAADLFLHLQQLSLRFHSRQPVGDTIARITGDSYCTENLVLSVMLPLAQSSLTIVATFFILWNLNAAMTLVSLGVAPLLLVSTRFMTRPMRGRSREKRDLEGQMMSLTQETLTAIPAVQAFSRERAEHRRFQSYADATVRAYIRLTVTQSSFRLTVGLITALATAALMYVGGRYALKGEITTGTIILFMLYLQSLFAPLGGLGMVAATYQTTAAEADRVYEILETRPEIIDLPDARDSAIHGHVRYEHVWFAYDADRPVLKDVSFEAAPGQVVAIVGPTGAGKTTLISQLVRFYDPSEGRITVDGLDLRDLKLESLRRQVAIVLQDPFLFPRSVAENISFGRSDATPEDVRRAAIDANADDFIRRLPNGYDTIVGERGTTLSGGEKQRISLARAFLKDAPILILDEATSQLDARTEAHLLDALKRLMQGRTTLIIAHRLSTIRNADTILVIDGGRIIEQGSHAELMMQEGLYASLYRQQMEVADHDAFPSMNEMPQR